MDSSSTRATVLVVLALFASATRAADPPPICSMGPNFLPVLLSTMGCRDYFLEGQYHQRLVSMGQASVGDFHAFGPAGCTCLSEVSPSLASDHFDCRFGTDFSDTLLDYHGDSIANCAGTFVTVNLFREDVLTSTPPETPLSPTKTTSARFVFDVTGVYDPLPFECNLDSSGWQDCTPPVQIDGPLADGLHIFEVRVAGNPATRHEWSIDTQAPQLTFIAPPSTILPSGSRPSISINASEAVLFECASEALIGDSGFHSCSEPGVTRVILTPPEPLEDGRYLLSVRAFDAAKNEGKSITLEWTVDECVVAGSCQEKQCDSNGTACVCLQGFYLDLRNDHICRACPSLAGCAQNRLHCTNGADSVCGDCVNTFDDNYTTTSLSCSFISIWR